MAAPLGKKKASGTGKGERRTRLSKNNRGPEKKDAKTPGKTHTKRKRGGNDS